MGNYLHTTHHQSVTLLEIELDLVNISERQSGWSQHIDLVKTCDYKY